MSWASQLPTLCQLKTTNGHTPHWPWTYLLLRQCERGAVGKGVAVLPVCECGPIYRHTDGHAYHQPL
jgi:hypothetical protein